MDACQRENKQIFIMLRMNQQIKNMLSKFIRRVFWYLRTEKDMYKENIDLDKELVKIQEKW
jgi:hypothetical protein